MFFCGNQQKWTQNIPLESESSLSVRITLGQMEMILIYFKPYSYHTVTMAYCYHEALYHHLRFTVHIHTLCTADQPQEIHVAITKWTEQRPENRSMCVREGRDSVCVCMR